MNNNKETLSINGHFMVLTKYSLSRCSLPYDFSALMWFFLFPCNVTDFSFLFVKHSPGFYNLRGLIFGDKWCKQTNKQKQLPVRDFKCCKVLHEGSCRIALCQLWGCINGGKSFKLLPHFSSSHFIPLLTSHCPNLQFPSGVSVSCWLFSFLGSRLRFRSQGRSFVESTWRIWKLKLEIYLLSTGHAKRLPVFPLEPYLCTTYHIYLYHD